jgi:hypothetical protein
MKKIYRVSESQLESIMNYTEAKKQTDHGQQTLSNEISIDEDSINEVDGNANVFTIETTNIDLYNENLNLLFKDYVKPGTKNVILVDGNEFDVYLSFNKAIAKYNLSIEYKSYGIKSIELIPISVSLMGTLDLTGDNDSFEKSFEITIEGNEIKDNTLSGESTVGEYGNINISDLTNDNVMLTSKRLSDNQSFYLTGIEINEKVGRFLIEFQY